MSGFLNETNQEQTKNLFLAVVLVMGITLVFQAFMTPRGTPPPEAASAATASEGSEAAAAPEAAAAAAPAQAANVAVLPPQTLRSGNHRVEVTNAGARVVAVHVDDPERYRPHADIRGVFPVEDETHLPVALTIGGLPDLREDSPYAWLESESRAAPGGDYSSLAYRWTAPDGQVAVTRRFEVDEAAPFSIREVVEVQNLGATERRFEGVETHIYGLFNRKSGGMFSRAGSVLEGICVGTFGTERKVGRNIDEVEAFGSADEPVDFFGVDERYFLLSVAPVDETVVRRCSYGPVEDEHIRVTGATDDFSVAPGQTARFTFAIFSGPKDKDYLDAAAGGLRRTLDFGWFSFIAVPLRSVLLFIQGYVVNWGIAIILLTFVVKLLLFPVTQRSYESMEKMKLVQPQLSELQKRYENDKGKLAEEQMALFKREGVSPLGGCLPMLAQTPIYIALYRTVWGSTELYNAPLAGWIRDLSQPDPYFVLPILLGVLMFAQNKIIPPAQSGGGEMQQQMAQVQKFMPLLFTMMMLFLPSGLVLYIFVNMLLSIGQMLHIRKKFEGKRASSAA
ncbi:MAG: membrane protein insertase YidC [Myxococcales bacterium]|nr:membrane protein insertase YidC [Myxococcales bacterium]